MIGGLYRNREIKVCRQTTDKWNEPVWSETRIRVRVDDGNRLVRDRTGATVPSSARVRLSPKQAEGLEPDDVIVIDPVTPPADGSGERRRRILTIAAVGDFRTRHVEVSLA